MVIHVLETGENIFFSQIHTEKIEKEAEDDLLSLICDTYTVSTLKSILQRYQRYQDCQGLEKHLKIIFSWPGSCWC